MVAETYTNDAFIGVLQQSLAQATADVHGHIGVGIRGKVYPPVALSRKNDSLFCQICLRLGDTLHGLVVTYRCFAL